MTAQSIDYFTTFHSHPDILIIYSVSNHAKGIRKEWQMTRRPLEKQSQTDKIRG